MTHNVHDVGGDDGLVVLALLLLAHAQEVFDDGHQEAFFVLFVHGARDGADGPAERVEIFPRPFVTIDLK